MGRFAGAVFIRNEENQSRETLLEKFNQYMDENGYVSADSDHAERKYCFSFPEGKWFAVTLREEELFGQGTFFAKIFNTYTATADLVDDDFIQLELFQPDGISIDHEIIGVPYWDEPMFKEDISQWFRFLKNGVSEEKLISALNECAVIDFNKFSELIEMNVHPLWMDKDEADVILYFRKN